MEDDEVCEYTDVTNVVEKGKCLEKMRISCSGGRRGGAAQWDSIRPWDCDDVSSRTLSTNATSSSARLR